MKIRRPHLLVIVATAIAVLAVLVADAWRNSARRELLSLVRGADNVIVSGEPYYPGSVPFEYRDPQLSDLMEAIEGAYNGGTGLPPPSALVFRLHFRRGDEELYALHCGGGVFKFKQNWFVDRSKVMFNLVDARFCRSKEDPGSLAPSSGGEPGTN